MLVAPVDYRNIEKPQGLNVYQRAEEEFQLKKQLAKAQIAEALKKDEQKNLPQGYRYNSQTGQAELIPGIDPSFGKRADPYGMPMAVFNPQTGQMQYASKGEAASGSYMPAPPTGYRYNTAGGLVSTQTSPRDQSRIDVYEKSGQAASSVESLANEASNILSRYETSKAAPIIGTFGQFKNAIGLADQETKSRVTDFESLDKISKQLGVEALQQFGGNDTDKELQVAIQTNIDPSATVESNMNTIRRKLVAAKILQQKPIFAEEWLNKNGSLSNSVDPVTGETFSKAWLRTQRELRGEILGGAAPQPINPYQNVLDPEGVYQPSAPVNIMRDGETPQISQELINTARKAPDGNWYVSDPNRPGKFLQVQGIE